MSVDCRPIKYKNSKYVDNSMFCSKRCPYYQICTDELGRPFISELSNHPRAIASRLQRKQQSLKK